MRVRLLFRAGQGFVFFALLVTAVFAGLFSGCRRPVEEGPVEPSVTYPMARDYLGYGVVNGSFIHLMSEPGAGGVSVAYLRRGSVVRVVERRRLNVGTPETWLLAEGNYARAGNAAPAKGWLRESSVEMYDNEIRAETAAKAFGP